jgi:hypothetical protein
VRTFLTSIAATAVVVLALPNSASAIDKAGAVQKCSNLQGCEVWSGGDSVIIKYKGNSIRCPAKGECSCDACHPPPERRQTNTKPAVITPLTVLREQSPPAGPPRPAKGQGVVAPGLLDGGSTLNTSGPAATGTPTRSAPAGPSLR